MPSVRHLRKATLIVAALLAQLAVLVPSSRAARTDFGINLCGGAGQDYNPDKPWADAMRSHRHFKEYDSDGMSYDENYWPLEDAECLVWHGLETENNYGTYRLSFTGQATDLSVYGVRLEDVAYDAAANKTTAKIIVADGTTGNMCFIRFKGTNGGVKDVKLMRPLYNGATESYPEDRIFTDQFLEAIAPFKTLRFMDWLSTNHNDDSLWSHRTLWSHATQKPPEVERADYGWQGRGGSWESVVKLCNLAGKDAWVCIPHKVTDDYIRKVALLFKYGSDGVEPYTSPQANPVHEPLHDSLKLYIEYSNEIWNFVGAFSQTPWSRDQGKAYGHPLDFDGADGDMTMMQRWKVMRSVAISTIFREVFGDAAMMSRIRPVLEWQVGNEGVSKPSLNFLSAYYGGNDPRSDYPNPQPPGYFFYGAGGTTYWNTDGGFTLETIWENGEFAYDAFYDKIKGEAIMASAFGFEYCAYEGNVHPHVGQNLSRAFTDPRIRNEIVEHQNAFNAVGGELNMWFNLSSISDNGFGLILKDLELYPCHRYQGILDIASQEPRPLDQGVLVAANATTPTSWDGKTFDLFSSWGGSGSGSVTLTAADAHWASYAFRVAEPGIYSVSVDYSPAGASAELGLEVDGERLAALGSPEDNTAYEFTAYPNTLYSVRLVAAGGEVTVGQVTVTYVGEVDIADNSPVKAHHGSPGFSIVRPNASTARIVLPAGSGVAQVSLQTLHGRALRRAIEASASGGVRVYDISDIPAGVYVARIRHENRSQTRVLAFE